MAATRYTDAYDEAFTRWARFYQPFTDWRVLKAQGVAESGLNPVCRNATSGALGMMQFMPATARQLGVNPLDPESAIQGAAMYDRMLEDGYPGAAGSDRENLGLASYDAGPANVAKAVKAAGSPKWSAVAVALSVVMGMARGQDICAYVARINGLVARGEI